MFFVTYYWYKYEKVTARIALQVPKYVCMYIQCRTDRHGKSDQVNVDTLTQS
jgi:hypothetical protein